MTDRASIDAKITELQDLGRQLPAGPGQLAVDHLVTRLRGVTGSLLNEDGTTNNLATALGERFAATGRVPSRAMIPDQVAEGDGHALVCC